MTEPKLFAQESVTRAHNLNVTNGHQEAAAFSNGSPEKEKAPIIFLQRKSFTQEKNHSKTHEAGEEDKPPRRENAETTTPYFPAAGRKWEGLSHSNQWGKRVPSGGETPMKSWRTSAVSEWESLREKKIS